MRLDLIAQNLNVRKLTTSLRDGDVDVTTGFVSDLLSDVLAHAGPGSLLVTVQAHMNVVAVAVSADLAGVVFAGGRVPEEAVIQKAAAENLPLLVSDDSAFEIVGKLYEMGVRGSHA